MEFGALGRRRILAMKHGRPRREAKNNMRGCDPAFESGGAVRWPSPPPAPTRTLILVCFLFLRRKWRSL